jgi:hypothetical protein
MLNDLLKSALDENKSRRAVPVFYEGSELTRVNNNFYLGVLLVVKADNNTGELHRIMNLLPYAVNPNELVNRVLAFKALQVPDGSFTFLGYRIFSPDLVEPVAPVVPPPPPVPQVVISAVYDYFYYHDANNNYIYYADLLLSDGQNGRWHRRDAVEFADYGSELVVGQPLPDTWFPAPPEVA